MREYKQLTEEDRIEIYAMKQAGKQQKSKSLAIWAGELTAGHDSGFQQDNRRGKLCIGH